MFRLCRIETPLTASCRKLNRIGQSQTTTGKNNAGGCRGPVFPLGLPSISFRIHAWLIKIAKWADSEIWGEDYFLDNAAICKKARLVPSPQNSQTSLNGAPHRFIRARTAASRLFRGHDIYRRGQADVREVNLLCARQGYAWGGRDQ